jgi:hypothetical protein
MDPYIRVPDTGVTARARHFIYSRRASDGSAPLSCGVMQISLPEWLRNRTPHQLQQEIAHRGENAYIEKLWLDDLASA